MVQSHAASAGTHHGHPDAVRVRVRGKLAEETGRITREVQNMISSARLLERLRCIHGEPLPVTDPDTKQAPVLGSLRIRSIQAAVSHFYTVSSGDPVSIVDLCSSRRAASVMRPRQVAMYLCRKFTTHSLPEIGKMFGGKNHTGVLHNCRMVEREIQHDTQLAAEIGALVETIQKTMTAAEVEAA